MNNNPKPQKKISVSSVLKLLLLVIIIIGIPLYIIIYKQDLVNSLKDANNLLAFAQFLKEYQKESIFVYLGLQILQIVISVLPGQIFQMAAGYLYGILGGLLLSILGAALGSTIAYFLAYFLGQDIIRIFIKEDTLELWIARLNSKKAYIAIFLLYLIPGLPKDMLAYPAGIARINYKAFIIMSLLGRTPAMTASILVGAMYEQKNYFIIGIVAAVSIIIFFICLIKRQQISQWMDRFYENTTNTKLNTKGK